MLLLIKNMDLDVTVSKLSRVHTIHIDKIVNVNKTTNNSDINIFFIISSLFFIL